MDLFSDSDVLLYIEMDNVEHKLIQHCQGPFGKYTRTFDLPEDYIQEIKYEVNGEEVTQYVYKKG